MAERIAFIIAIGLGIIVPLGCVLFALSSMIR